MYIWRLKCKKIKNIMKKSLLFLLLSLSLIGCNPNCNPEDIPRGDMAYIVEGNYNTSIAACTSTEIHDILIAQEIYLLKTGEDLIQIKTGYIQFGKSPATVKVGVVTMNSVPLIYDGSDNYSFEAVETIEFSKYTAINGTAEVTIRGRVVEGNLYATMEIDGESIDIMLDFDGKQVADNKANLSNFTIIHDAVNKTSMDDKGEVTIFVKNGTALENMKFSPIFMLSKGAISHPKSDVEIDFSKAIDKGKETNYVTYIVLAEDGKTKKTYKVKVNIDFEKSFSFEEWISEVEDENDLAYTKPSGGVWATSNLGAVLITIFPGLYSGDAIVYGVDDGQSGKGAAIKTANTTGMASIAPGFPAIPKITSGSLFWGDFEVDMVNTLNSTKFGLPYFGEPKSVKGYFKYTPGAEYFACADPVNASNIALLDPSKTDECALSAVLYEVSSFANTSEILTGVDIFNSDKIVAMAQKFSAGQDAFEEFELVLDYKKEYDATKSYRLALLFSSSKDGDKFSGAPESLLIIDEVEIFNK